MSKVLQVKRQREIFGLSLLYWGLWLAILILWMGRFVTSFLSIYLVSALHINEGVVGTVVSMYGFGSIVGCLFGGTLSDRFGRQPMIVIGEIGAAAALLVVSILAHPIGLGAALFVYGAFASLPSPAIAAYIADVVPVQRQQRAYVLQSWAINFGYAIGPIVANQLVKVSYSLMFYVEAAVMIGVTALLVAFFREVKHLGIAVPVAVAHSARTAVPDDDNAAGARGDGSGQALSHDSNGSAISLASTTTSIGPGESTTPPTGSSNTVSDEPAAQKPSPSSPSMRESWRRVLTDVPFLAFSVLMFGYFLVYFQSTSGLPIAMTNLGLGLGDYSVLLTINGFMLCALQIPAMKIFARMGNSRVLVAGLAVTVIGYAVQIVADSWAGFALAVVLWTLGELGTFPIATTTVAAMAPSSARGTYQGVYNVLWSLSIALAPMIGGWVISDFGGRVLWIACTLVLIAVTCGLRVTKASRDRAMARNVREQVAE
ncbi:permease [Bifidobacterium sp. DSM 109959]|uniref:Permease n=1 Tax=Bifidobacterium olomucense TaxID=2675324 RepID=A0A7Y0EY99_9BIFI|nr:MFS transporter [Bifidobacterium sp. DSM 109959]NMM98633.1 permease [Bifidobacterium sp. DSM 109959]